MDNALPENIDAADMTALTSISHNITEDGESVCCAIFLHGVHKFVLFEYDHDTNLDIHSLVVLSSQRFAFIGDHAHSHWGNTVHMPDRQIFVHACKVSRSLRYSLTTVKGGLVACPCILDPGGLELHIENPFDSTPRPTEGEGLIVRVSDPICRILERIESRNSSARIARDGLPYSFSEFVTWYGAVAIQRWCEAAAMKTDIRRYMMVRVLQQGKSNAARISPTVCLEGHTPLKTYHWQPETGLYQRNF